MAVVRFIFIIILTCIFDTSHSQNPLNQLDSNGERHGAWKKNFNNTDQPRYEGQFEHGKEVGLFKFYTLVRGKSSLSATKQFNKINHTAQVKFYSSKGKLISEGMMDKKKYVGNWVYYHNKSDAIMTKEYYNVNGKLEGERTVFYENGKVAEVANYKDGKLEGSSKWYSENDVLLKEFHYQNDELHGPANYYDADGELVAEGRWHHDAKTGVWNYYRDGELFESKDFTKYSKNPKKQ